MAFCVKCGQKLNESDSFCPNCGNKVVKKVVVTNENNVNQEKNITINEKKENQLINHQQVIDQAKESLNNLKLLTETLDIHGKNADIINTTLEPSATSALLSNF